MIYSRSGLPAGFGGLLTVGLVAMGLAGCSKQDEAPAKRPPEVGFRVVKPTSAPFPVELSGRTSAFRTAEVRPQATGVIQARLFTEGALVRQGQPLYRLDQSLYRAATAQAEANLAAAQANAAATQVKADRYKPLAGMAAVSQQEYTDAQAQARVAAAAVAQQRAALQTARVNLRFATVPAPITGRIGRSLVTEGALATASQATPLAVIAQLDPIYVDIQQSASELMRLRKRLGADSGASGGRAEVRLKLDTGEDYPLPGTLEFSEVTVAANTGTVTLRARFPNPENLLLPGMFVRTVLSQGKEDGVFLVPQGAVGRDPRGNATVLLVGPGGKAVSRPITAERTFGADWVVTGGLKPGDKVITQGLGKAKPNQLIRPVPEAKPQAPRTGKPGGKGAGGAGQGAG